MLLKWHKYFFRYYWPAYTYQGAARDGGPVVLRPVTWESIVVYLAVAHDQLLVPME